MWTGDREGKEDRGLHVTEQVTMWATRAQSCWATLGDWVECALESSHQRVEGARVLIHHLPAVIGGNCFQVALVPQHFWPTGRADLIVWKCSQAKGSRCWLKEAWVVCMKNTKCRRGMDRYCHRLLWGLWCRIHGTAGSLKHGGQAQGSLDIGWPLC